MANESINKKTNNTLINIDNRQTTEVHDELLEQILPRSFLKIKYRSHSMNKVSRVNFGKITTQNLEKNQIS
jgi:DNA recombination-dependent growth factor C